MTWIDSFYVAFFWTLGMMWAYCEVKNICDAMNEDDERMGRDLGKAHPIWHLGILVLLWPMLAAMILVSFFYYSKEK